MKVTRLRALNPFGVEMIFEGTKQDVDIAVSSYMEAYHPVGYGTYITESKDAPDDTKRVTVWRANSCD
jgi:hypothetical protein